MIYTSPLNWPAGFDRTSSPKSGYQFKVSLDKAERELGRELELMGVDEAYISIGDPVGMNGRPKAASGNYQAPAVLHFLYKGQQIAIPCDAFDSLKANVRALGLTVESIRRMERYGTSAIMDRALSGFTAIAANATGGTPVKPKRPWHEVLGVTPEASRALIDVARRDALKRAHPDAGGSEAAMKEVMDAYQEAIND